MTKTTVTTCPCECGGVLDGVHVYAGKDKVERERHRVRAYRRREAAEKAVSARAENAQRVLARLELTATTPAAVLAETLGAIATDVSDLAVLVGLDLTAADPAVVKAQAAAHARTVRQLEDHMQVLEETVTDGAANVTELETRMAARADELAEAVAERDEAVGKNSRLEVELAAAYSDVEEARAERDTAVQQRVHVEAELVEAVAARDAALTEGRAVRETLAAVHLQAAEALALQQRQASAVHEDEMRAAVRRADEAHREVVRQARAEIAQLLQEIEGLGRTHGVGQSRPSLIIPNCYARTATPPGGQSE